FALAHHCLDGGMNGCGTCRLHPRRALPRFGDRELSTAEDLCFVLRAPRGLTRGFFSRMGLAQGPGLGQFTVNGHEIVGARPRDETVDREKYLEGGPHILDDGPATPDGGSAVKAASHVPPLGGVHEGADGRSKRLCVHRTYGQRDPTRDTHAKVLWE